MTTDEHWLRSIGVPHDDDRSDDAEPTVEQDVDVSTDPADAPDLAPIEPAAETPSEPAAFVDDSELDSPPTMRVDTGQDTQPARRFTPWVAAAFGLAATVATIVTVTVALWGSGDPSPTAMTATATARPLPPPQAAPTTASEPVNGDAPIPFTASSDCLPGSTSAQSLADPQSHTPWICVAGGEGQVLTIDLGRAYVITAVSIVPGAITKGPADQGDPWLQHRVVTWLQWQFNDTEHTIRRQNTQNVHGKASLAIPSLLASQITVIIQQTSRPPQIAPPTTTPPSQPGDTMLGPILGAPAPSDPPPTDPDTGPRGDANGADPSDNSFAVSSIEVIGHRAI